MEAVANLKIVQSIFEENLPDNHFDLIELFLFSRPRNRKVFYIGKNREGHNTLFKHADTDKVYYDVLNKNAMYQKIEMRKAYDLDYLVKEKKIERRYKNDN